MGNNDESYDKDLRDVLNGVSLTTKENVITLLVIISILTFHLIFTIALHLV